MRYVLGVIVAIAFFSASTLRLPEATSGIETDQGCYGDCNANQVVTVDELVALVAIALGDMPASECVPGDLDGDTSITVDEILRAIDRTLKGCLPFIPSPTPTLPVVVTVSYAPSGLEITDVDDDGAPDIVASIGDHFAAVLRGLGDGSFATPLFLDVGILPSDIIAVDLNRDGYVDLVTSNSSSQDVSVLLGNGAGGFATDVRYPVSGEPESIEVSDLNGDEVPDLVTVVGSALSLLLGIGDGTFRPVTTVSDRDRFFADSVAIADIDGDGNVDLVSAAYPEILIFPGTGTGNFGEPRRFVNGYVRSLTVADINHDGAPDIVESSEESISIHLASDGGFSIGATLPGDSPRNIVAVDVDADTNIDLVAFDEVGHSVYMGGGDGTFNASQTYSINSLGSAFAFGDVDGDGTADLVAADEKAIAIAHGRGRGRFAAPVAVPASRPVYAIAAGNFAGSVDADLIVIEGDRNNPPSWLRGNGNGTLAPPTPIANVPGGLSTMAVGDINRDSFLDLVLAEPASFTESDLFVVLGADALPAVVAPVRLGTVPQSSVASDFDADGQLDVVLLDAVGRLTYLRGIGDGTFANGVDSEIGNAADTVVSVNFDGDGKPDLAMLTYDWSGSSGATDLRFLSADNAGAFTVIQQRRVDQVVVDLADFDRDGRLDLLGASPEGEVSVLLVGADGTLNVRARITTAGMARAVAPDFNRDGIADLLIVDGYDLESARLSLWSGRGDGTFIPRQRVDLSCYPTSILPVDLDGDDNLDVVLGNEDCDAATVYFGSASGTLQVALSIRVAPPDAPSR